MTSPPLARAVAFISQASEGDSEVPVDLLHWLVALSPIVVLLALLAVFGWKAPQAGPIGMFLGAGTALLIFQTPLETLTASVGAGVWDAVFVLYVVWGALLLYRAADSAGALVALRKGIERFSKNQVFLVLAFGWVFASFLQGITGFGVPVAVVAPILVALGVKPVMAVVIPLIGHAWANMFGTLGVAWLATLQVANVEDETHTAILTAILLWIVNLLGGATVAWLFGRWSAVLHALPFILIISAIHGGGQLGLVFWDPILSTFLATAVALVALYPLSRWKLYGERAESVDERPAVADESGQEDEEKPPMSFIWSLLPYGVLTAMAGLLAIPVIRDALDVISVGLPFPETETGYGVVNDIEDDVYSPFAPFTHPGFFVVVAAVVTMIIYRVKGFYAEWADRAGKQSPWKAVAQDALPASLAIVSFLVLAKILEFSGQTEVLALGIAEIAPPLLFAFLANFIGVLGAFMTSSNTASNILFTPLQDGIASNQELPQSAIIAAQSAGGAVGNVIAPANIVLGTSTAGIVGKEGQVLRATLPWAAGVSIIIGAVTLLLLPLGG